MKHNKIFCNLSVPADDVSIHLMYSNVLDIHNKHTATHLHVDVCECQDNHCS